MTRMKNICPKCGRPYTKGFACGYCGWMKDPEELAEFQDWEL